MGERGRWGLVERAGSPLALAAFLRAGSLQSSPPNLLSRVTFLGVLFFFIVFEVFFPLGSSKRAWSCRALYTATVCKKGHHLDREDGGGRRRGRFPGRKQKWGEPMALPSST